MLLRVLEGLQTGAVCKVGFLGVRGASLGIHQLILSRGLGVRPAPHPPLVFRDIRGRGCEGQVRDSPKEREEGDLIEWTLSGGWLGAGPWGFAVIMVSVVGLCTLC